jgi:hypothetical protein
MTFPIYPHYLLIILYPYWIQKKHGCPIQSPCIGSASAATDCAEAVNLAKQPHLVGGAV